jgi:hypothetical protein
MNNTEQVIIKTKYADIESCKASVDKIGRSKFFVNGSGKLYGEFENNHFVMTSTGKVHGFMAFEGEFTESDEGVIMKGIIRKREDMKKRHKFIFFFTLAFAVLLFMSLNPIFMFMSVLFVLVTFINMRVMDKNKSFHKMILNRLTE